MGKWAVCLTVGVICILAGGSPASATLFGVENDTDQLVTIDPATGAGTAIGALGLDNVNGLTYDPVTETLFGIQGVAGVGIDQLVTINTTTGAATVIGATGFSAVLGLAFDPATGTLYGNDQVTDQLLTINPITGIATPIGSFGGAFGAG
jgi:glucose/arabinose dehydrogenase